MQPIIGIDLGTTNSEVAVYSRGKIEIVTDGDDGIVPSVVGQDENGDIIVGRKALNQAALFPERTVLSIKRRMGKDGSVDLGDHRFSPQEISAFILKGLKQRAEKHLHQTVDRAVITVPAYFTDAQRQATREAGEIAGLEVVRIINEPTAAALMYEPDKAENRRLLVYDLGGGTFDVSIVKIEQGVVEVMASTGNNQLGGDDFDAKLAGLLVNRLKEKSGLDIADDRRSMARLLRAAEAAKRRLSTAPFARVEEDHIGEVNGQPVHLSVELTRHQFEDLIEEDLAHTMQAVIRALKDADMLPSAIDRIVLVGGSTRIPRIAEMLEEQFGLTPHGEIDPELCVAMGAGMQAAREMGLKDATVLVDITPYSFGTSAVGVVDGEPSLNQFVPLIRRNTKLPAGRSDVFYTLLDDQKCVKVKVYQGEASDATQNVLLGDYLFQLTPAPAGSEITLHFDLNLNGILKIRALEKQTGKHIDAVIENALPRIGQEMIKTSRARVESLWDDEEKSSPPSSGAGQLPQGIAEVVQRAEAMLESAAEEDREEMINLIEGIHDAIEADEMETARQHRDALDELLFFIEDEPTDD